ncbi:MAG: glycosyltransferase family 2 protein [bacterium]
MRISIVMPTRNKVRLLERTLASLAAQDADPSSFEAVVVDDASTDDTPRFLGSRQWPFALRVVRQEENRGRAAARNRGIAAATGDLVVFLDDDMEAAGRFLTAHRALHARGGRRVAGIGNVVNHPEITVAPIDRYMSTRGAQKIRSRGPLPWKYFSTNNASVARADLTAIGGFDENFVHYGFEDLELAWRLEKERGVAFEFVEEARSLHIHPHTLDEVLSKKLLAAQSSLPYFFRKHPHAKAALGFTRFEPPRAGDPLALNLERVAWRAVFNPAVCALVKPIARGSLGPVTDAALDYLVQYHYLLGLQRPL